MGRHFSKVLEEEIEEGFIYPSDLVNTKTTIPLRVGERQWICYGLIFVLVVIFYNQFIFLKPTQIFESSSNYFKPVYFFLTTV